MAHHPAAFINAIAEEGTKAEAIEWLQKTWDENCELKSALNALYEWYDKDGSVGGASAVFEEHRSSHKR